MFRNCFFFFRKQFKSKKVMKIDAPESISEKRWRTHVPDSPFDEKHIADGTNCHLARLISLSSLYARITYDWHVSGGTTEYFWRCTLRHVLLWWWVGGCVVVLCCHVLLCVVGGVAWLCVVARVVWLCLSRWGLLSGGRLPSLLPWSGGDRSPQVAKTPGCPRHRDEAQTPTVP